MMGYGFGFGSGGFGSGGFGLTGLLGGLGSMLLLAGLVILVAWAVTRIVSSRPSMTAPAQRDPLDLLRERFARGELTEAEFVQARRVVGYER